MNVMRRNNDVMKNRSWYQNDINNKKATLNMRNLYRKSQIVISIQMLNNLF